MDTMIHLDVPASTHCGEKGCTHSLSVKLVFNAMGTWNPILPEGHGWQIKPNEQGIFTCFCPLHRRLLEQPASAAELVMARNGKH